MGGSRRDPSGPKRRESGPNPDSAPLNWQFIAHSEIGLVRKNNQDSGMVSNDLLLVADGMGGAAAGDLASAVAVDTISRIVGDENPDRLQLLAGAISAANTRIADLVETDHTLEGMGTTVTAAILDGDQIDLAHIGDSRAYLLTDTGLTHLTHDHSWVQSLIDDGKINQEEAAAHPHRSLLLKVLNGQPANEPDLRSVPVSAGQRLLLCSDGLCGFVEDDEIAAAMTGTSRDEAMQQLVAAAHEAGGLDNITIIIADLYDPEETTVPPSTDAESIADDSAGQRVSGPTGEPQLLGAAFERDASSAEEMVAEQAALRAAATADFDGLDSYDDFDDADPDGETEDEDRYAPQPPSKRRWRRPLILTLVAIVIIAVVAATGLAWTRTQYYVGAADQNVAIFQGMNESLPGISLSRVHQVEDLTLDQLPPYYQALVRATINTGTLAAAQATVVQLEDVAERCPQQPSDTTPGSTNSPSPADPKSPPAPTPAPSASGHLPGDAKC